jgi:hypothetical protein
MCKNGRLFVWTLPLLLAGCAAQHPVFEASDPSAAGMQGVRYTLPRTRIRVKFAIEKNEFSHGDFAKESQKYLKKEAPLEDKITFALKDVAIDTVAVADEKRMYVIKVEAGAFENNNLTLALSTLGFPSSTDSKVENKSTEIALTTIESVAGIVGKFGGFGGTKVPLGDPEADAQTIANITSAKLNLASGRPIGVSGVNLTGDAVTVMLAELNKELADLLQEFQGKTTTTRWDAVAYIDVPDVPPSNDLNVTLFKFSPTSGVTTILPDLHAPPGFSDVKLGNKKGASGDADPVDIQLKLTFSQPLRDALHQMPVPKSGSSGLFYRIPLPVHAGVVKNIQELAVADILVAQMGAIAALPADTGSMSSEYNLEFDRDTGAVTKFVIGSTAMDPKLISGLGTSAGSLLDDLKKAKDAQSTAANNAALTQLQMQRQILEERVKIKEAETKLGVSESQK